MLDCRILVEKVSRHRMQVLPMAIAHSPARHLLKATFKESSTLKFQDGVGEALLEIARAVPDGMLVFMPSYGMLEKLTKRWKETGAHSLWTAVAHSAAH